MAMIDLAIMAVLFIVRMCVLVMRMVVVRLLSMAMLVRMGMCMSVVADPSPLYPTPRHRDPDDHHHQARKQT